MVAISRQRPISGASNGAKASRPSAAQKVAPVSQGQGAFNEFLDAGTLLDKRRVIPSAESLDEAHHGDEETQPRLGQLIDLLV